MSERIGELPVKDGMFFNVRRFMVILWAGLMLAWTALRLINFFSFGPHGQPLSNILFAFAVGLGRDLIASALYLIPAVIFFLLVPRRALAKKWGAALIWTAFAAFIFSFIFCQFAGYYFFEEFRSNFNTVAVDYLLFPYEVAVNIWESYHVGFVLAVCAVITAVWVLASYKLVMKPEVETIGRKKWALALAGLVLLLAVSMGREMKPPHVGPDRTLNEIANNPALSFIAAAWTHQLDYAAFYETIPLDEAYARTRKMLSSTNVAFETEGRSIHRMVSGDPNRPKLNVVVILEESMGSEFWGCLGRKDSLTPNMDQLAKSEGLLFTDLYACGNRTVRGMEGVLSSFPPLPGDSIVKRPLSDNVETLARVLRRDGYTNVFLYGGRGIFDSMRSYAMHNGYDRFVEQKDFDHPTFTTAWGVCDEDLFARGIQECRGLAASGKPFFATFLTTSNHKPYTYPQGRIPEDPSKKRRSYAVKYADYSLGRFFDAARKESFWTNTVFVVVADHGARVYGKQTIPIHSYEIPLVILGPAVVKQAERNRNLGSSLDVAPTILGLIGRPYESTFFGRDLCAAEQVGNRALMNHNRDIGMLESERMVVLELMKNVEFYEGAPKKVQMTPRERAEQDADFEKNCMAIFEVADDLYMHKRYTLDEAPTATRHAAAN